MFESTSPYCKSQLTIYLFLIHLPVFSKEIYKIQETLFYVGLHTETLAQLDVA